MAYALLQTNYTLGDAVTRAGNYSENGTLNSTIDSSLYHVPPLLVGILSFLYGTISVLSVVGNGLVIVVIIKNRPMHTVTNFFIANLATADVMIGTLSIPFQFQAALMQRWDLPFFMCPVAPFVKQMSVTVSITTLTVISIDRYFAIIHPLKPRCSKMKAYTVMAFVWLFSIGSSVPMAIIFKAAIMSDPERPGKTKPFCSPYWPEDSVNWRKLYSLYLSIMQYFLPVIIISFAYFRIIFKVWGNRTPGSAVDCRDKILNKNKRKVIKMLMIVVALFVICWMPIQMYNLLSQISNKVNEYKYINIIFFCSDWLAMSNSCYNPFIYGLLNEKYKHGFRMLFSKMPCRSKGGSPGFYMDHTEESFVQGPNSSSSHQESIRIQANGGRPKRYTSIRVSVPTYGHGQSYL